MVLDDFFSEKRDNGRTRKLVQLRSLDTQLAKPIDRLAANVADLVLFLPVLALVMAPFSRRAKEAQMLGLDDAWTLAVASGIFAAFFALIIYQTLFVALYGGTPGKLALRLRVVSIWGVGLKPRPIEAFIRAIVWALEACTLGVPFLAVFSNLKRRPFHDRASDTAVIALSRNRQGGLSTLAQMSVASGFQSAVLAVVTLTVSVNFVEYRKHRDSLQAAIVQREDEGRLCPEVRESLQETGTASKHMATIAERLETSLTLFAAGAIDRECLGEEAELAFWRNREPALAYLAKGLALSERETDKAETYFEKACESERAGKSAENGAGKVAGKVAATSVCAMVDLARAVIDARLTLGKQSVAIVNEQEEDDTQATKSSLQKRESAASLALASVSASSPSYLKAEAIHQLLSGDTALNLSSAMTIIDSFHGPRRAGAFIAKARVQALWRLGQKASAMTALKASSDLVELASRVELARWMCNAETEKGGAQCTELARTSCAQLASTVDSSEGWLVKPDIAVAYIRGAACSQATDLRLLKEKFPLADAKAYLEALALLKDGRTEDARAELISILEDNSESHGTFFLEASLQLTDLATSKAELADVSESWRDLAPLDPSFRPLGRRLLTKLTSLKAWNDAVTVGLKLTKFDSGDPHVFELVAAAATASGQPQLAAGMLRARATERLPASAKPSSQTRDAKASP